MVAMQLFIEGALSALSLLILPYLPTLIIYNIAESLGSRLIISRIILYSAGALWVFQLSVYLLSVFPGFFIVNQFKIDILYGSLVLYLGYIIARRKLALVIRAARGMTQYWYVGSFFIGATISAIWVNHLALSDPRASRILEDAALTRNIWVQLTDMAYFAGGITTVVLLTGLITFFAGQFFSKSLAKHRDRVRIPCGLVFITFAIYILLGDAQILLMYGG